MQGYPNGEFRPTANITREEAAKLIAIFDNKDSDISTYYTSINRLPMKRAAGASPMLVTATVQASSPA